jgi:hypothetical protein
MIRHSQPALTLDDLERLAFTYGGTIERNVATGTYTLVGALMDGRRVNLGPVRELVAS